MSCRKIVQPRRNELIERYLIWPHLGKIYGEDKLIELEKHTDTTSCTEILDDILIRRAHLRSRHRALSNRIDRQTCSIDIEAVFQSAENLLEELEQLRSKLIEMENSMETMNLSVFNLHERYRTEMENYGLLCEDFMSAVHSIHNSSSLVHWESETQKENYIREKYLFDDLDALPNDPTTTSIHHIQQDINTRRGILEAYIHYGISLLTETSHDTQLRKFTENLSEKLRTIDDIEKDFTVLLQNSKQIQYVMLDYINLLTDKRAPFTRCSKFAIIMEELRFETEENQRQALFPETYKLISEWQRDPGQFESFKPKIPSLFRVIETDLREQLRPENMLKLPFRIGLIGATSVGKSTIASCLGNFNDHDDLIRLERSTFSYLQQDATFSSNGTEIQISLIDIEGAIDEQNHIQHGNYFDLIRKADCDVYLIIFDREFSAHNRACLDFIENEFSRSCVIVMSKADRRFLDCYEDRYRLPYDPSASNKASVDEVLRKLRQISKRAADQNVLDRDVYLMAARPTDIMKTASFIDFDKNKLLKDLATMAQGNCRRVRIGDVGISAAKVAINTCFRRAYVVSTLKYRIGAAFASILPLGDEAVSFFGREAIRKAFGIHEHTTLTNKIRGRKHSLEEYLKSFNFFVPKSILRSSYFDYLAMANEDYLIKEMKDGFARKNLSMVSPTDPETMEMRMIANKIVQSNITGVLFSITGGILLSLDDVLRVAIPAGAGALRIVSMAGLIFTAATAPLFAAWAFYATGRQLTQHLHKLCDDSFIVAICFIVHICRSNFQSEDALIEGYNSLNSECDENSTLN